MEVTKDLRLITSVAIGVGLGIYGGLYVALRSRALTESLRISEKVEVKKTVGLQLGANLDHLKVKWGFSGVDIVP